MDAFECEVVELVIVDTYTQATRLRVERRPTWHGPTDKLPFDFEPQVIVEARRSMALNDESALPLNVHAECCIHGRCRVASCRVVLSQARTATMKFVTRSTQRAQSCGG